MEIKKVLHNSLEKWKEKGYLHVAYALLFEFLSIAAFVFVGLFSLEMLLPTFITARLSLAKFFFFFVLGVFILLFLGKKIDAHFENKFSWRSPLLSLTLFWTGCIFLLSLYKFPLPTIPILFLLFFAILFLFFQLLFKKKENEE